MAAVHFEILKKIKASKSTHPIYAFRIKTGKGILENFDSDGDHGVGFELLKSMMENKLTNTVCLATRICNPGFQHIGKRRFIHINKHYQDTAKDLK